jgi:hypothetical protein
MSSVQRGLKLHQAECSDCGHWDDVPAIKYVLCYPVELCTGLGGGQTLISPYPPPQTALNRSKHNESVVLA